jgi:hypothetical protein
MNEQIFKTQFIAAFLASWCADNYDTCCSNGTHHILCAPPVEEASYLADKAWMELEDKCPEVFRYTKKPRKL